MTEHRFEAVRYRCMCGALVARAVIVGPDVIFEKRESRALMAMVKDPRRAPWVVSEPGSDLWCPKDPTHEIWPLSADSIAADVKASRGVTQQKRVLVGTKRPNPNVG